MNRIFILTPLIVLLIICIFSLAYLLSGKDPNKPPSALLNKDVPVFKSSSLYNSNDVIKTKDIKNKKTLINFFASWCSPCKIEHPLFFEIRKKHPELYLLGFNHKDPTSDARKYLEDDGNPYHFVGVDSEHLLALPRLHLHLPHQVRSGVEFHLYKPTHAVTLPVRGPQTLY